MKSNYERFIWAIGLPLLVGWLSSNFSGNIRESYQMLTQPPLSPPGWVFGLVWTILFTLMGVASYLVMTSNAPKEDVKRAMTIYYAQLAVNFFWTIIFFGMEMYLFAFFWLLLLLILIAITIINFYEISKLAAYLMVPYFLWVLFAGYLNLGIYLLN